MKRVYKIQGLDCAACAAKLERKLSKVKGVSDVNVDFMLQKTFVETDQDQLEEVFEEAERIIQANVETCERICTN